MISFSLVLLNLIVFPCNSDFTKAQQEVLLSLTRELHIGHLIVVTDTYITQNTVSFVKFASFSNIFSMYSSLNQMYELVDAAENLKEYHPKILILLDTESAISYISALFRLHNEHILSKYIWAVFDVSKKDFQNIFDLYFPYNCQFLLIALNKNKSKFEISEIYHTRVYMGRDIYEVKFGEQQENKSLVIYEHDFYKRRFNLHRVSIPVLMDYYPRGCWDYVLCAFEEMVLQMSHMMNFTLYFLNPELLKKHHEDNIRILHEIHLGVFVFDAINFSPEMVAPIWKESAYFHIKYEKSYEQGHSAPYSRPFRDDVKVAIITWIIASGICIMILNSTVQQKLPEKKSNNFYLIDSIFQPLDSFQNQCGCKISKVTASRIALFTTRILPLCIGPVYSAVITSFLTVQIINLPFNNLEELIKDGSFKIGFENFTASAKFFRVATDPVVVEARDKFLTDPKEMPQYRNEGTDKLCKDNKFVFVYFNNALVDLKLDCKILQIPSPIFVSWDEFLLRKHSSYKSIFNRILKSFFSTGIIKRMGNYAFSKKPREKTDLVPFKLESASQIYKLCGPIYLASLIIFFVEIFYYM